MSYTWSALKKDRNTLILSSFLWGFFTIAVIGALLFILNIDYTNWIGLLLIFIIFPLTTFIFYKIGYKRKH